MSSRILAVQESRLRYWTQTGFVGPTVRKGGRFYYTFMDLVAVKAAKDLLAADVCRCNRARKNGRGSESRRCPTDTHPDFEAAACAPMAETIVALADDIAFEPIGGQVVMAFNARRSFGEHVLPMCWQMPRDRGRTFARSRSPIRRPRRTVERPRIATSSRRAPRRIAASRANSGAPVPPGDRSRAEHVGRADQPRQPGLSPGRARKKPAASTSAHSITIRCRPRLATTSPTCSRISARPSSRSRSCGACAAACPDFADAHYNLGLMLAQVGGTDPGQAAPRALPRARRRQHVGPARPHVPRPDRRLSTTARRPAR